MYDPLGLVAEDVKKFLRYNAQGAHGPGVRALFPHDVNAFWRRARSERGREPRLLSVSRLSST